MGDAEVKGGGGGKKPPEDKIEFEELYKIYDDDDSSTETPLELEVTPEQLSRVNPNRPVLRLRLSPRKRVATAAPGGSPPPGGITQTGPLEGPGHGRPVQPSGGSERLLEPPGGVGGGGLPQPPGGVGGGGSPWPPEGSGRPLRHPGGGGAPPPGGNGNGNGGGGGQPPPRRGGDGGGNGDDGDDGGDSSLPSDPGQPQHLQH